MFALLALSVGWAQECPQDGLSSATSAAASLELAYANVDDLSFRAAQKELDASIPCIRSELTVADAVTIHRAMAISNFVLGESEHSRASWGAVRGLQPEWTPQSSLMPEGHPMRDLWETSAQLPITTVELEKSPRGGWGVDGVRQFRIPDGRAYLLQGFDETGQVILTGYYYQTSIPEMASLDLIDSRKVHLGKDPRKRRKTRLWGSVATLTLAAGSGVAIGLGVDARHDMYQEDNTVDQVIKFQRKTNTLSGVGVGLAAAALGTGVLSWTLTW